MPDRFCLASSKSKIHLNALNGTLRRIIKFESKTVKNYISRIPCGTNRICQCKEVSLKTIRVISLLLILFILRNNAGSGLRRLVSSRAVGKVSKL